MLKSKQNPLIRTGYLLVLVVLVACQSGGKTAQAPTATFSLPTPILVVADLPSPTPQITSTSTPTPVVETPTAEPTATPAFPDEFYISGVRGHKQYFPIGCEAGVAVDWAAFFGEEINEFNFQYELPLSDNPDLGFVGEVHSPWGQTPPYGYGVHAAPIAELLQQYGLPARAAKGFTLEQVKQELSSGEPLIAWVIGNMVGGVPAEYTDKAGNTTIVAAYEHVVLLTGYDSDSIRYNNNGKVFEAPTDVFLSSWGVLGNMVVYFDAP